MLLPDVNVVLAAFRPDHVHHDAAAAFLDAAYEAPAPVGLSDLALSGVLRLATNPRVFKVPDSAAAVNVFLEALLHPPGLLVHSTASHWRRFTALCSELSLKGNDVPDAYLAALALDGGAELVTLDRGFGKYPGLRWRCLLDD